MDGRKPNERYQQGAIEAFAACPEYKGRMAGCVRPLCDCLPKDHYPRSACRTWTETVVDLDMYEQHNPASSGSPDCTVDYLVGLGKNYIQMVEAKLEAQNMRNVASSIVGKVRHSADIISQNLSFRKSERVVILLADINFEVNRRTLERLLSGTRGCPAHHISKVREWHEKTFSPSNGIQDAPSGRA